MKRTVTLAIAATVISTLTSIAITPAAAQACAAHKKPAYRSCLNACASKFKKAERSATQACQRKCFQDICRG